MISLSFDIKVEGVAILMDHHLQLSKSVNKPQQGQLNATADSEYVLESLLIKIQLMLDDNSATVERV